MKKYILICFVILGLSSIAQELPKIVPPSPTAASLHSYGNNSVSYYSGTADMSIPIYEISEGEINLPITLRYTGGNGIKVEENASWVGLGWALNAGGAISRTKRGVADDDDMKGMISYGSNGLPDITGGNVDYEKLDDIGKGKLDGEPDKFFYNTPTGSGSFFIDYANDKYITKPYRNIDISYDYGKEDEGNYVYCNTDNLNVFRSFTIVDEKGTIYTFREKERNNSYFPSVGLTDKACFPSTWYLTKIQNRNRTKEITLEYETYTYSINRLSPTVNEDYESVRYNEDFFLGKRLKKINFPKGSIEFVKTTNSRKDIPNEYALEQIIVKNQDGEEIKNIVFSYGYFTENDFVEDDSQLEVSKRNRLVLTSVQEKYVDQSVIPPYVFEYNTNHFLPSTESYAKDHWGYYNGKTSNRKFENRQLATYYHSPDRKLITKRIGSANREVDTAYAKAGILKRVVYPTGGSTKFEYEGNTAVNPLLNGKFERKTLTLDRPNVVQEFDVNVFYGEYPRSELTIRGMGYETDPAKGCFPIVYLENVATGEVTEYSFDTTENTGSGPHMYKSFKVILLPGTYRVRYSMKSYRVPCLSTDEPVFVLLSWDDEDPSPTKQVGGVRIKKITHLANTGKNSIEEFEYVNEGGESSGDVVEIPRYFYHHIKSYLREIGCPNDKNEKCLLTSYYTTIFQRSVASHYPLINTAGNVAGYSKVVVHKNKELRQGKTEYSFHTPKDFSDSRNEFFQNDEIKSKFRFDGRKMPSLPVTVDSKEFLRGKLIERKDYSYQNDTYTLEQKTEYTYKNLFFDYDFFRELSKYKEHAFAVNGLSIMSPILKKGPDIAPGEPMYYQEVTALYKSYEIYSGYSLPESTKTTTYNSNGEFVTESVSKYLEHPNEVTDYYTPVTQETRDSRGNSIKSKTYYPFNSTFLNDWSNQEQQGINALNEQHAIYTPIHTENYNGDNKISQQRTQYSSSGIILPEVIKASKGENILQDKIIYRNYDAKGNPIEVAKADGIPISYIWGYDNQYPVAKVENATYKNIIALLGVDNLNLGQGTLSLQQESTLRTGLPNAFITTYTYKPLVGVTSITDPRGVTMYYEYDHMNRLKMIKDEDGNLVSEQKYNYKK